MEIKHIGFNGEFENRMRNIACLSWYWIQFFPIKHYDIRHILLYYCLCSLPSIFHMIYSDVGKNLGIHHGAHSGSPILIHTRLAWSAIDRASASILWCEPYIKVYRFVPTVVYIHKHTASIDDAHFHRFLCHANSNQLVKLFALNEEARLNFSRRLHYFTVHISKIFRKHLNLIKYINGEGKFVQTTILDHFQN